jgi:hypothetical protein
MGVIALARASQVEKQEAPLVRMATKLGLEQMLREVSALLSTDLSVAQKLSNEEIKAQIMKHLEDYQ